MSLRMSQLYELMDDGDDGNISVSALPVPSLDKDMEEEDEAGYGWLGYRPRCLGGCLSSRWILFFCCVLVGTQGMVVTGLTAVVLTSIEKRFFLRSSQVGGIFACYDIGSTILTVTVSYFGHTHKPRWLGVGSLVLGLGCLVFALPQFLAGSYEPVTARTLDLCMANQSAFLNGTNAVEEACRSSEWYHLFVFVLGQLLIGAGASPIYNVGSAYLDENVTRKNSGVYLGIFYAVSTFGPGVGFLLGGVFLSVYVDINLPEGVDLKQDDNSWIGAWWLGYLFGGLFALLASVPLLGFPREVPHVKTLNDQKRKALDTVPDEQKPHTTGQFFPALKSLLTNKVFLCTTLGGTAEGLSVAGTATFFPKFMQSQFHLTSSNASFYAGLVIIPGGIIGMLLGGYVIRRFQWTCAQCIKACTIIALVALLPILIFIVHCPNEKFAGVTTSYFNRTTYGTVDICSSTHNCSCKQNSYIPICTKEDQITYFSPCHAGCRTEIKLDGDVVYTNCSCLPPNITLAYDGGCVQSCNAMGYFLAVIFVLIICTFFNNIPAITVTLRCVPESQGSFALGVQQIITRILAFIPAPIVYGALLDYVCILSETDPCNEGEVRNCLEYKNEDLSYVFLATTMICKVTSFLFFALAWLIYKPPKNPLERQVDLGYSDNVIAHRTDGGLKSTKSESTPL